MSFLYKNIIVIRQIWCWPGTFTWYPVGW